MNTGEKDPGGGWLLASLATAILAFLLIPQMILLVQSFTAEDYLSFPPRAFGFKWYWYVLTDERWRRALGTSLVIAGAATPLALILGTAAALGLDRGPQRGRRLVRAALVSPMVLPHVVLGLALYRVFLPARLDDTVGGFIVAHLLLAVPYVVVTVGAGLETFNHTLEEAAQSLGASPARAFFHITLPIIAPGLLAGAIFSFVTSFDEFIVTFFLATRSVTIPIQIFGSLSYQIEPSIAAVSGLTLVVTALLSTLLVARGGFGGRGNLIK
jgi:ABC-type spermidine/putrescine transport system permease subunit II